MPAITKPTPLSLNLKNVLNTNPNEWKKFYDAEQIKKIFSELALQIQQHNFFYTDYSINIFLDFLKSYVHAKFTEVELKHIDGEILQKFNIVWSNLQHRIIDQRELSTTHCNIVKDYIDFLRNLLGSEPRNLFTKSQISFSALDFQNIGNMLNQNSIYINEALIESYTSLLKLSFDTPKFLSHFEWGLGISPLAETIFLNKQIDSHFAVTRFFDLLGYQGQLLDYYRNNTFFNITDQLVNDAIVELENNVINLQRYFFYNLNNRDDIDKPLLQHYLYTYFFKVIYKKHPQKLDTLKKDLSIIHYIKLDYVALPNSLDCQAYLPTDMTAIIEYKNLTSPDTACRAMACSSKSYEQWQQTLGFHASPKSNYIFRVADSYEKYSVTYAYGYAPTAGGFYLSGEFKNNIIYGQAYSYFSDEHQFIEVSRHEAVHHDNFKLYFAAQNINPEITFFTNRNFNEGLAVLFAGGACAPGYSSQDFSNETAPNLDTLLKNEYLGYSTSWLYNNYFIQQYSDRNRNFYSDLLHLNKTVFRDKWGPILNQDKAIFFNWLSALKQHCKNAPNELSVKNCPSIYLKDYLPVESNKQTTTITTFKVSESPNLRFFLTKKMISDQMGRELLFKISDRKFDEFRTLLENGANPNFRDETTGNTPLHFLYYYGNCDVQYLELLLKNGAKVTPNVRTQFPLQMAEETCNAKELLKIQEVFYRHARQQKLPLTITMPIASFTNGVISSWSEEIAQRRSRSPYIPSIIFYGLKPVTLAMTNSAINLVFAGSAEAIGLDDVGLSFTYYLIMNYVGIILAQFGERITNKLRNKFLNMVMSILLYTFFLNPSLLVLFISEGFMALNVQSILQPLVSLLSGGIFFKAGEYSGQKFYQKFFPINPSDTVTSQQDYFLRYSLKKSPKKISTDQKTLREIKEKLFQLTLAIEKHINKQVYQLNFKENLQSAKDTISILIEKINKDESKELNEYKAEFTALEKPLINIQSALTQLNQCSSETKIQSLWDVTTDILITLRGIRPFPQINKVPDVLPLPELIKEEQTTPLMVSFSHPKESQPRICNRYTRPPSIFGRMKNVFFIRPSESGSEFPKPPTEQELHEMGIFMERNNEKSIKIHQNRV